MSALGSLIVKLALDSASYEQGMTRAEHVAARSMQSVAGESKRAGGAVRQYAEESITCLTRLEQRFATVSLMAKGFAAINYVARPLADFARDAVNAADEVNELAEKTGIAVDTLSRLKYAAAQSGTDIQSVGNGMRGLSKLMFEAASGNKEAEKTFRALGVSMETVKSGNVEAVLKRLADLTKSLPAESRAGFLESIKKGLSDLGPLLAQGSEGLQKLFVEAEKAGAVIGGPTAAAADEFKDKLAALSGTLQGVAARLMEGLLPTLTAAAGGMQTFALAIEDNKREVGALLALLGAGAAGRVLGGFAQAWVDSAAQAHRAAIAMNAARVARIAAGEADTAGALTAAQATAALKAQTASHIENLAATVRSTQAKAAFAAMQVAEAQAAVAAATGMQRLTLAQTALVPAQIRAAQAATAAAGAQAALTAAQSGGAVAAGLAGRAVGLLGGPVGAIVTLLGLGATAWTLFGDKGRESLAGLGAKASSVKEEIARLKAELHAPSEGDMTSGRLAEVRAELQELYAQQAEPLKGVPVAARVRAYEARQADLAAKVAELQQLEELLSEKIAHPVAGTAKATNEGEKALKELQDRLRAAQAESEAFAKAEREREKAMRERGEVMALVGQASGVEADYVKDLQLLYKAYQGQIKGVVLTEEEYVAAIKKVIDKQPAVKKAAEERAKAEEEHRKRLAAVIDVEIKNIAQLDEQIRTQREHNQEIGLTKSRLEELKVARLNDAIATKEQQLALALYADGESEYTKALQIQIDKLKELRDLKQQGAVKEATAEAAQHAAEEWQRTADDISRSLTDALVRGFEGGEGAAKGAIDAIKNVFKAQVIKVFVEPVVKQGVNLFMQALGMGGTQTGTGGGGFSLNNLTGYGNLLGQAADYIGIGSTLFGSSAAYGAFVPGVSMGSQQAAMLAAQTGEFGYAGLQATAQSGAYASGTTSGWGGASGGLATMGAGLVGTWAGGQIAAGISGYDKDQMNYAAAGAAIGSYFGPVGTLVGGVLGGIVGAFADPGDAERSGRFVSSPDPNALAYRTYNYGSSPFGSFAVVDDKWFGDDIVEPMKNFMAGLAALDTAIAATVDPTELAQIKERLSGLSGEYGFGMEHTDPGESGAFGAIARDRYAAVFGVLDSRLGNLIANFQGTGEELTNLINTFALLRSSFKLTAATAQENVSVYNQWVKANAGIREFLVTFTGSQQQFAQLTAAIQARYALEQELVNQIAAELKSIKELTSGSIRDIRYSVLDEEGRATYLRDEANRLYTELQTALDPEKIGSLSRELNDVINKSFQLVGPDMQKEYSEYFVSDLQRVQDLAAARLEAAQQQVRDMADPAYAASIGAAIEAAMARASERQLAAAEAQQAAAQQQQAAAQQMAAATTSVAGLFQQLGDSSSSWQQIGYTPRLSYSEVGY